MLFSLSAETIHISPQISIAEKDAPMPVHRHGKYYNPPVFHPTQFGFFDQVKFFCHRLYSGIFHQSDRAHDKYAWYGPHAPLQAADMPTVQWIGHATCLIHLNNFTILTDPIFGDLSYFVTYRRMLPAGIDVNNLPPIDMILISHNHRDHLDEPSLLALVGMQPVVLVPEGVDELVRSLGFKQVYSYTWWQQQTFTRNDGKSISCTFVPASHGSGRSPFDFNKSLWGGWMMQAGQATLYFAGDTSYEANLFASIAHYFPSIAIAMIPIAPGSPRFWMAKVHLDACDALQVCDVLHPKLFIPIHWGTFRLSSDTFDAQVQELLAKEKERKELPAQPQVNVLKVGESVAIA